MEMNKQIEKEYKINQPLTFENKSKLGVDKAPNKEVAIKQGCQKEADSQIDFGYNLNDESERKKFRIQTPLKENCLSE